MKLALLAFAVSALVAPLAEAASSSPASTMRAAVFTDGKISVETVQKPEPQSGQVRIKVRAASVNPVDWKMASRAAAGTQLIPGRDLSGVIDAVGSGVNRWKVGDEVIAVAVGGSYAEYALAAATAVAQKPTTMPFDEAAGIPIVGETAWRAIVTVGDVQKGQRVLIHGGAGGVGSSAVQIAKARGAHVIATASPRNHEYLRSIGADELIDYNTVRFEDRVKDLDFVLNTVDAQTSARSIPIVKKGGVLVSVAGAPPADKCAAAPIRCAATGGFTGEMLPRVVELANAGKFRISIYERFSLVDVPKAWESSRGGHTRGKIVLDLSR
jgi:NADPH:quinone reductase-like Zn-dependent oxidoreductase